MRGVVERIKMAALKGIGLGISRKGLHIVRNPAVLRGCWRSHSTVPIEEESIYTEEHKRLRESLRKLIDNDINPHVDKWEEENKFPAHKVFKNLGNNGFLGPTMPEEYGGLGLDISYSVAIAEELGHIRCGAVPMAIGVQTDMSTPALAKYGSDELKKTFLAPAIAGSYTLRRARVVAVLCS